MAGAAGEARHTYSTGAPDVTPVFLWEHTANALVFLCDVLFPLSTVFMRNVFYSVL